MKLLDVVDIRNLDNFSAGWPDRVRHIPRHPGYVHDDVRQVRAISALVVDG